MRIKLYSSREEITKIAKLARTARLFSPGNQWEEAGQFHDLYSRYPENISYVAVAYDNKDLIGIAIIYSSINSFFYTSNLKLGVYIKPKYRRIGIGSKLIKRITQVYSGKFHVCTAGTRKLFWKQNGHLIKNELYTS